MSELNNERLDSLAKQINSELDTGDKTRLEHYYRAGQYLIEAKAEFGEHGHWASWLADNCPGVSARKSQRLMALAKCDVTSDLKSQWREICGNILSGDEDELHNESDTTESTLSVFSDDDGQSASEPESNDKKSKQSKRKGKRGTNTDKGDRSGEVVPVTLTKRQFKSFKSKLDRLREEFKTADDSATIREAVNRCYKEVAHA